jgi:RNA polymerase sigma-70 factor (ECF subfamily)
MDAEFGYRPGSKEDFDRLYQAAYPRLLRSVYAVLGNAAEAEDCVQEAFVRAFQAWPRWKPDHAPEAWLHQIAFNVAISHRRRAKLREVGELVRRLGRPVEERDPADAATRNDIVAALAKLSPKVSAAFVLRHYHGYTNREIAAMTNVSERMVGLRLEQARKHLAQALGPEWRAPLPTSAGLRVDLNMEALEAGDV